MSESPVVLHVGPDGMRVVPTRLFPAGEHQPSRVAALGLGSADFLFGELDGMGRRVLGQIRSLDGGESDDWSWAFPDQPKALWTTVAELLISVGNSAAMLMAAMSEIAGVIEAANRPGRNPYGADSNLHRATFLLEASEQYAVSIGHQLTATAFRVCATEAATLAALRTAKGSRKIVDACLSGPGERHGWPSHGAAVDASHLLRTSRSGAARCMLAVARLYESSSWRAMTQFRDDWFHRLRPDFLLRSDHNYRMANARCDTLIRSLRSAAAPLRAFALGLDAASPVMRGGHGIRLVARDQVVDGFENGKPVLGDWGIDVIRRTPV